MREVRTGVWHWEAGHPEWDERQWWGPLVSSYAIDDDARLVLFDPLAPPAEIEKLARAGRRRGPADRAALEPALATSPRQR